MRSRLPVFRRTLAESWRGVLGWTIGVAAVLFLYLPLYPSIGGGSDMQQIIDSLPDELVTALGYGQISSGPGYTQATFFGLMGFLLLSIAAISWGAEAIAGREESGRLELDLAHRIGRVSYALEGALSLLVRMLWLALVAAVIIAALNGPAELDIAIGDLIGTTAGLLGATVLSGTVALLVGAATGRRAWATGAGAAVAVLGYACNAIANQATDAEWLRALSPYAWAFHGDPLLNGPDPGGLWLLWGVVAVSVAASAAVLARRDITG